MTRTVSPNKRKALKAAKVAAEQKSYDTAEVAVGVAIVHALLEVAFQIGRVADNVPLWGPPEEH